MQRFYYFNFRHEGSKSEGILMANNKKHCRAMIKSAFPKARLIVIKSEKNCLGDNRMETKLAEVVAENSHVGEC